MKEIRGRERAILGRGKKERIREEEIREGGIREGELKEGETREAKKNTRKIGNENMRNLKGKSEQIISENKVDIERRKKQGNEKIQNDGKG